MSSQLKTLLFTPKLDPVNCSQVPLTFTINKIKSSFNLTLKRSITPLIHLVHKKSQL